MMNENGERVALVTGAAGEIGAAIARALARNGVKLALVDRLEAPLAALADQLRQSYDVAAMTIVADIGDDTAPADILDAVAQGFGRLDYLVNNAGMNVTSPLGSARLDDWNAVMAVNLTAPMRIAQAAIPFWQAQGGGAIVNVASRAWLSGSFPAYTASKAGLVGLTRSFAVELGGMNVRANAVAPGFVDTQFTRRDRTAEALAITHDRVRAITPLGRIGLPEDVANAVAFLLSDEASFITGEILNVSGGAHLAARSTG